MNGEFHQSLVLLVWHNVHLYAILVPIFV